MKQWYKNSAHQMDDPEMEYLQSQDAASCAVWEWIKGACKQRDEECIPFINDVEFKMVSRRLGIEEGRLESVLRDIAKIKWIEYAPKNRSIRVRSWGVWQAAKHSGNEADRKRREYWKKKAEEGPYEVEVPGTINTEKFIRTWMDWVKYRNAHPAPIANKKLFYQKQLDWLGGFNSRKAAEILEITMRNGWQGLDAAVKFLERR